MPAPDQAPALEAAFDTPPEEFDGPVARIEGEIPPWLAGTWYLNGPARFGRGEVRYQHWLDGDGMVGALRLDGSSGGAHFTARYVRSHKYQAEEEAGRALFRTFGTAFPGDQLLRGVALASPVNVSVYPFAGKLLAFGEQGLPWELDPETLETLGEHTFGRRLNALSPFSAHPKFDPESGEMWNFGISFATAEPTLTLYRFSADGDLVYRQRRRLDLAASVHDFNISEHWIVLYLAPYLMDVGAFLERGASVMESLSWQPERGSRLLIFSRETGEFAGEIPIGSSYCLHHIHAFERGRDLLVDVLELSEPAYQDYQPLPKLFTQVKRAEPMRYTVDVGTWTVREKVHLSWGMAGDFPAVDPALTGRPYEDFWMLGIGSVGMRGRKFLDHLVHLSWVDPSVALGDIWFPRGPRIYLAGEPVYVSGPAGRGALLVPEFNAKRRETAFLIFDPTRIAPGPVARLTLSRPLHLAFHTCFVPARGMGPAPA